MSAPITPAGGAGCPIVLAVPVLLVVILLVVIL